MLVELAQNAADAATRAGVRGRLRFELDGTLLRVANTGTPIDAAGVESASTLRASSKRADADDDIGAEVGRFGVGFAAVLAVSDEPAIVSNVGSVGWSLSRTREAIAGLDVLADEAIRRGDALPVLRLPFVDESGRQPAQGFDTEVFLPLRDAAAVELVRELLEAIDAVVLLTLPALQAVEIVIDGHTRRLDAEPTTTGVLVDGTRWWVHSTSGLLDRDLLRDRPVEERARRGYAISWALPVDAAGVPTAMPASVPAVVHAPTPTDEVLTLPALLVAPLPLDPTRRHVASGPLRDFLLAQAASSYAGLVRDLPPDPAVLSLVPVGVAAGAIDGELRAQVLGMLRDVAFLSSIDGDIRLRPTEAVMLDDAGLATDERLTAALAPVLPNLVAPNWVRAGATALNALGVRRVSLALIVDELATVERAPSWWRELYDALARAGVATDELAGLPVPLGSGGAARSARGLLMPGSIGDLTVLGLRTVDPEAAHPLLLRLGAVDADPHAVLSDDRVRAAVENSFDAGEPDDIADAVLHLVAAAGISAGDQPWLADLALRADDGELYAAGELLLPGGTLAGLVTDDSPFGTVDPALVERWGSDVLAAVGVLDTFALVVDHDVMDADHDLDLETEYLDGAKSALDADEPAVVGEFVAVRDLELVRSDAWGTALQLLARPPLRAAVTDQTVIATGTQRARVPSYTAWWLRRHGIVSGRVASSDPLLAGLFELVDLDLDEEFLVAAGALRAVADADPDEVVARLGDPAREVTREQVRTLYASVVPVQPPARVRGLRGGELAVVDADQAVVVDAPDLLPLLGKLAVVPASLPDAERVADALDVALATEVAPFRVVSSGEPRGDHVVHSTLLVADVDGTPQPVSWRFVDGTLHVDAASLEFGLGRGRAWRAGRWSRRYLETELLRGPADSSLLLAEADLD
ncbi:MAG: hypothetical protein QOJ62_2349 [Actinomycetota bacterium]|nr:hypothetical protein [Actinomycetota bacterium]